MRAETPRAETAGRHHRQHAQLRSKFTGKDDRRANQLHSHRYVTYTLLGAKLPAPDLAAMLGVATVTMANNMRFGVIPISMGDIISAGEVAMRVIACLHASDDVWRLLGVAYKFVRKYGAGALWQLEHPTAFFTLVENGFSVPVYWTFQEDGLMLTLCDDS